MDSSGSNVYIADYQNNKIRKVNSAGILSTFAGTGAPGTAGDNGLAISAQLNNPQGISLDSSGNLYIADSFNYKIRKVTGSIITTYAGTGALGTSGDGGPANAALLNFPTGVSADNSGNVFVADYNNHKIRKISSSRIITTVAGTGSAGVSGDGGPGTSALLNYPYGVSVDISGNVYIADSSNNKVRKLSTTGIITTIAGTGTAGSSVDNIAATSALLKNPRGVSIDISGNVYIADNSNNKIRMVSNAGIITTIAGTGTGGNGGDGGLSTSAQLKIPSGLTVDGNGNVYVADSGNNKIRLIFQPQPSAIPTATPSRSPTRQPTSQVN